MILNYENLSLGFIGDIHGDFQKLQQTIKHFENTLFIVAGDCGFGFSDTKEDKIKKMLKSIFNIFLEKRNIYLLFIRGNHDNPAMFNGELFSDRFKLISDYTLVTINNTNILCVGGAVSVDRRRRTVDNSYWYNEEMIDCVKLDYKIDILCTHTINRDFIVNRLPATPTWLQISFQQDKKLKPDGDRENNICSSLFNYYNPKYWIHGHYHISYNQMINDCNIISLDCNELYEFRNFNNN